MFNPILATDVVGLTDIQPVIDAMTAQINVSTVISVVGGVMAVSIGLVFMWWGIKKGTAMLMKALRKGKA